MRLGVVSAKASPGATTVALAIAASTGGVMVEADPAGGDVECWAGPQGEPGLIRLAGRLRHTVEPAGVLAEHAVEVWPGVRAVLAPVGGEQAESTLMAMGERLAPVLRAADGWVVVDAGRWGRTQPTAGRLAGCDAVAMVLSPTLAGVAQAQALVAPLQKLVDGPLLGVVVGDRGYSPAEVAGAVGVPVAGVVAWDPRWVQGLLTAGASRWWHRSPLARSVRSLVDRLESMPVELVADRA